MSGQVPADDTIVGAWSLTSFTEKNLQTGAVAYPLGKGAKAPVIYTADGHVVTLFTSESRKPPVAAQATDQEAVALYRTMVAFAGRYELRGTKLIYRPEISWNEAWNGTVQERFFERDSPGTLLRSRSRSVGGKVGARHQHADRSHDGLFSDMGTPAVAGIARSMPLFGENEGGRRRVRRLELSMSELQPAALELS